MLGSKSNATQLLRLQRTGPVSLHLEKVFGVLCCPEVECSTDAAGNLLVCW